MLSGWKKMKIEGWESMDARDIQEIRDTLRGFGVKMGEVINPPLPIRLTNNGIIRPEKFFLLVKICLKKRGKTERLVLTVSPINSDGNNKKNIVVTPRLTIQFPRLAGSR